MRGLLFDLRSMLRSFRRSPALVAGAVALLAVGVGVSTGLLTLLQRAVLDRLPVRAPQELVHVVVDRGEDGINYNLSYPLLAQLREGAGGPLPAVVGHAALQLAFSTGGPPERVDAEAVTPDAFAVLGVPLAFGRDLRGAAGEHAVVLGEELWRRRFDGDRGVLGREVRLNGRAFTVVGVAPRAFRGLARGGEAALWVALPAYATLFPAAAGDLEDARMSWLNVFARTAPGSEQAFAARLGASTKSFQAAGALAASERLITLPGERGLTHMVEPLSRPLLLLNLLAALLLLLVAANFAGLLATRAVARRRELAVRASLGAARARLLRLLVVEALALTAAGALLAVPVALAALRFFGALPGAFGETVRLPTRPDARLLAIDVGLALLAGLAVALLPAWRASRRSLAPALRGLDGNNGAPRLRSALVVAQVALALTLLAGAGLFARTLQQLGRIGLGYEPRDVVVARVDLSAAGYAPQQRTPFWNELLRRVEALPGVRAAALASTVAPSPAGMSFGGLRVEGYRLGADESIDADVNVVSAGWFAALRVPLVAGRGLDGRDGAEALRAVVINESFARRYFAGRNPIGGRVFLGPPDEPGVEVVTIVGVAADAPARGLRERDERMLYLPLLQRPSWRMALLVRSAEDPARLVPQLRRAVAALDPALPLFGVQSLAEHIEAASAIERLLATLGSAFGLFSLLVAAAGLYGLLSWFVLQQRRDMAVRLALGARAQEVRRLVLGRGMRLAVLGAALGVLGGLALGRAAQGVLFEVQPSDPAALIAAAAALLFAALLACWLPARRAGAVDPMRALKED